MLSDRPEYVEKINTNLSKIFNNDLLPRSHQLFLDKLKKEYNFTPSVCYDIGSAVLHWTRHAERVWKGVKIYLFDAYDPFQQFYKNYQHTITVLSDTDGKMVKFYQNDLYFGGNSYYKEIAFDNGKYFPEKNHIIKKTSKLDTIVKEKNYLFPDLIKIDVQGAELDVLKGAIDTIQHAKFIIVELQNIQYNRGAPLANVTTQWLESKGWQLIAKFCDNGPDADYCFINKNK